MENFEIEQKTENSLDYESRVNLVDELIDNYVEENTPVLTPEQYRELFETKEILSTLEETADEETKDFAQSYTEKIRQILVLYNQRFIKYHLGRYLSKPGKETLFEFRDELLQEGVIGLMRAIDKYEYDHKAESSFPHYASFWIKNSFGHWVGQNKTTIRIPPEKRLEVQRYYSAIRQLESPEEGAPTEEEIMQYLEISKTKLQTIYKTLSLYNLSSLDQEIEDTAMGEGRDSLVDYIADPHTHIENQALMNIRKEELIEDINNIIEPRAAIILKKRFGLNGDDEMTLEEIGEQAGVTRERIRQIVEMSLLKLQNYYLNGGAIN